MQQKQKSKMIEQYKKLSPGQKAKLRRDYSALFGKIRSFYRRLNGEIQLSGAERNFFSENLNSQKQ